MLENREVFTDLHARLRMADIELLSRRRTLWEQRVDLWKEVKSSSIIDAFIRFVTRDETLNNKLIQVGDVFSKEVELLTANRKSLIDRLIGLVPPNVSPTQYSEWNRLSQAYTQRWVSLHKEHILRLRNVAEDYQQHTNIKLSECKHAFFTAGVYGDDSMVIDEVLERECVPHAEKKQDDIESAIDTLEANLQAKVCLMS